MFVTHDLTIDLLRPQKNVVHVTQDDSTHIVRLTLTANNVPYYISADADNAEILAFVEYKKPDKTGGIYDTTSYGEAAVELEDDSVGYVWLARLDGYCFTIPGWTQINVRFETEDGLLLHSFPVMVDVVPSASSDNEPSGQPGMNSIGDLKAAVTELYQTRISMEAKNALLDLLSHVAYTDTHGQDYLDTLETELFRTAGILSISAVFEQGSAVIYDTDELDDLRQYLTVTAHYEDLSEREVVGYTLSGSLTAGTSTITVSYAGKSTTFNATITDIPYSLPSGTKTFATSGETLTISKGNHIAIDFPSNETAPTMNLSDLTKNGSDSNSNTAAINNLSTVLLSLQVGDNVSLKMKNMTKTRSDLFQTTTYSSQFLIGFRKTNASSGVSGFNVGYPDKNTDRFETSIVVDANTDLSCVFLSGARTKTCYGVEFDLELWVNDVRYI